MLINFIKSLVVPNRCPACQKFIENEENICFDCKEDIKNQKVHSLDKKIEFSNKVYSSYYYYGKIRDIVLFAKYKSPIYFTKFFIDNVGNDILNLIKENDIDYVISAPFHKSKLYKYEYDLPSEILKSLSEKLNVKTIDAVRKNVKTQKQQDLSEEERKVNLINAFLVIKDIKDKNILLLDDIITTGNTISQLSLVLKEAGANKVIAYSFAIRKEE